MKHFVQFVAVVSLLSLGIVASAQDILECIPEQCVTLDSAVELYPEPAVSQLDPDYNLMWDRDYYRVLNNTPLDFHDTPGGTVVQSWKAGDNYLTVYEIQGEWGRVSQNL